MTAEKLLIAITSVLLSQALAIWPPSYRINLTHEETFVISEELTGDDTADVYQAEDEMIQDEQLKSFNLGSDSGKYSMLHQLVVRRNSENSRSNMKSYNKKSLQKSAEVNFDVEEVQPWESGFVDSNGTFKPESKRDYKKNETTDSLKSDKVRETEVNSTEEIDKSYDYDSLKNEYISNIQEVRQSIETLNYTETKEKESLNDAVKTIMGKSKQRNCTVEERKGIGMAAAKCLLLDLTKPDTSPRERSQIFHRIGIIILIWLLVYLLVAIPCWCQRGWCCCCFQCKFCKPLERIDGAKKYLLDNPVGVYHTPTNQKLTYPPTNYEQYAQKKLEKALLKI